MKLQAKLTLHFVVIVMATLAVSFFLINWSVQSQFDRLIQEKNQEWRDRVRGNPAILINPFEPTVATPRNRITPEKRFLSTVSHSLLIAAFIAVIIAVVLAYFLSKFLLQRIYRLETSMHHYMKDGTTKPVLHSGDDEVDELGKIYNSLIEKIEKEERIRKDFFIDMSHELRTPLTSIKGYLEGLIDKVFDPGKENDIHKKALGETDRMIRLIKEMTTLAKLETEEIPLSKEVAELSDLTKEVVGTFVPEAKKRDMKIEVQGNCKAEIDPHKFKQVMINLLDNALQYGETGSIIVITMGEKNGKLYWRIKNAAGGIDQHDMEYFFERFYRADKAREYDAKKPHLGIGLNIVKKIIEQHGGTISVHMADDEIIFEIVMNKD